MMDQITNGSYGLNNIPGFTNIFQPLILAAVCIAIMMLLLHSSYGRAFKAVRDDEVAAEAMGINLFRTKELSFVISSFFMGISGGMLALFMRSIDTKTFQITMTYNILLIVVLGGIGSIPGAMIGGIAIGLCECFVSAIGLSAWKDAVTFAILIIVLLVKPTGFLGRKVQEKV
mgnify:CR=1 FL=1